MENQWLLSPLADLLTQAGSTHQIGSNSRIFSLSNVPSHHFAAPNVDH
jgi:hypothetical protein